MVTLRSKGSGPRVVLIGKGVTFDSGGLSLKPADSMALMKTDMAGAAAVAGAMLAYAAQPGRNGDADVWALLPMAENAVSGRSYRPGDVITHPDGRTSEVANTDAEGRLLLADALALCPGRLDPAVMIDAATLTGAATLGLSRHYAALYSDVESLAAQLERAGEASGDAVWRMPLRDSYLSALGSRSPTPRKFQSIRACARDRSSRRSTCASSPVTFPGPTSTWRVRPEPTSRGEHPVGATDSASACLPPGYGPRTSAGSSAESARPTLGEQESDQCAGADRHQGRGEAGIVGDLGEETGAPWRFDRRDGSGRAPRARDRARPGRSRVTRGARVGARPAGARCGRRCWRPPPSSRMPGRPNATARRGCCR